MYYLIISEKVPIFWTLVDHNENKEAAALGSIVEIIDHHQVLNPDSLTNINHEIDAKVGSCSSLVGQRYLRYCAENSVEPELQIALMLHGVIILGDHN